MYTNFKCLMIKKLSDSHHAPEKKNILNYLPYNYSMRSQSTYYAYIRNLALNLYLALVLQQIRLNITAAATA